MIWYLMILSVLLKNAASNIDHLDSEVEHQCIQRCPLQNRSDIGHYDLGCDYKCNIHQCSNGCKLWKVALQTSCKAACNGTLERLPQKQLYCVMGCNDAMASYFAQLKARLGIPPAPALVADSLTATSLRLEWHFPEAKHAGLNYLVQWRYEELAAAWQFCRNQTWNPQDDTVFVENLQPYTKYRFRVTLLLAHHADPIVSAPSLVISTLPSGIPASPPAIVRAVPIDSTRVSVSWEPGPFPHGPILSYVLRITDNHPDGYSALKDIPAESNFYMVQNLLPARNYTVSVAMRNGVGAGPSAEVSVSTPFPKKVKNTQQPILILASHHDITEQGTDLFDEPIMLYNTDSNIEGIAIHINQRLLFVSESNGNIYRMPLEKQYYNKPTLILTSSQLNCMPLEMSMDWLNEQLYILCEVQTHQRSVWQIIRCNLDGLSRTVAIAGLQFKPLHIEVDPYNGYLFWTADNYNKTGLYRLDLSNISNGIKHEHRLDRLLENSSLGAFTVDHANYRILVSYQDQNTVYSVSLDGTEKINFRPHITKSKLSKVLSLAVANEKLYWTDGSDVFYEEYHRSDDKYYHNTYGYLKAQSYIQVIVNLPSAQPIPVPVNPPTSVQAIFGTDSAKATWQPPHLLGFQGKGAWQNWSYEIEIKDVKRNILVTYKHINTTSYKITNLQPHTEYVIKTAAYTNLKGPWSSEFKGISLKIPENGKYPMILWSAAEGLLKSDVTGENADSIIHQSMMKNFYFMNVAWYEDQLFLVTNTSQIFWYNTTTHDYGQLMDIESVGSIAVDWIGKKLYWSNPTQQLIIRGNLNGTQQEPLSIVTLAKELNIDAVKAYIYWSTGYAVECAHLNGADRITYHPAQLFSGKQVMGLTLDMDHQYVFWVVRGSEGSNLFRGPMAGYRFPLPRVQMISSLQKVDLQGPLCYFSNRLLWLQDDRNAAISDLQGKNIAKISGKSMSSLTMVYVIDSSLHVKPNISKRFPRSDKISVIPEMIDIRTIKVNGSWNSFNITWKSVQNINFGTVFYEINVNNTITKNDTTMITTTPFIKYNQITTPFTKLHVSIRAFTYWGTSPQVQADVFSPPSTPSAPNNLRVFVTYLQQEGESQTINATFRWDPPLHSNGVIQGYKIFCWYEYDGADVHICENSSVQPKEKEYVVANLLRNQTYFFQIQAYTDIGVGDISNTVFVNTTNETPLPALLISSKDSIFIQDVDIHQRYPLLHSISSPTVMSYLTNENKLFWMNELQEILMWNINSPKKYSKIFDIQHKASSLTLDWIERSLYYVETEDDGSGSSIHKLNLNHFDKGSVKGMKILFREFEISNIEISPFTSKLYWTEMGSDGEHYLMQSNTDGSNIDSLLKEYDDTNYMGESNSEENVCNCSSIKSVEGVFTIDHSYDPGVPLIYFIDSVSQYIISTDQDGCDCTIVLNTESHNVKRNLKSDFKTLYWTNTHEKLYSFEKNDYEIKTKGVSNIDSFLIYGSHTQPYPPRECLSPEQNENYTVKLQAKSSYSLTFSMPEFTRHFECANVTISSVEYRIYYKTYHEDEPLHCDDECQEIFTFETTVTVESLQPFTKYLFSVGLSNYYMNIRNETPSIGPGVVFQTAVGTPTEPQNVTATILNPTLAEINWVRPKNLNGDSVRYEIHWQTEALDSGIRQKGEQTVPDQSGDYLKAYLQKLTPNETYSVWVRAYSETNDTSSDSVSVQIHTFPEPSNITFVLKTAYTLRLEWEISPFVARYIVQYCNLASHEWLEVTNKNVTEHQKLIMDIEHLKPKTPYKFRFILRYPRYDEDYIWPTDARFVFETEGDRPSPPGTPNIQHVKADVYQVWWEASRDNGAPIQFYILEGTKLLYYRNRRSTNRTAWFNDSPSIEETEITWEPLYNGTDTYWIISGLDENSKYAFRVTAYNSYGWSDPSEESVEFDISTAAEFAKKPDPTHLILIAICVPVVICFLLILCFVCCRRHRQKNKKVTQTTGLKRRPDVELATLRELPRRGNFIHNTNVLYVSTQPTSEELAALPHIRRDQITLKELLGRGAFGEVYEGKARLVPNKEIKVAVKTLRASASEQEKNDFLQEAQLMSQFKHEHILQFLGVCLDNDPQYIIMELMQGGDLLTYLRLSRNPTSNTPSLTLVELLKMCVDVAKGCRYLEETHFVHRDLACRNCLVSSTDPAERIVKIGDFGLARDIYKNDYYRKEGDALLPVRWMAPESLVYRIFTCQSDVWAFGVLLWEIMTLGQQPYPALSNIEILRYLTDGERLGKPTDCPDSLHELMLKCWNSEPEKRPTFKYCLEVLEDLHSQTMRNPVTGAHEGQYISSVPEECEGVSNAAYFQDENHNNSGSSWKSGNDADSIPFLQEKLNQPTPSEIPKYLELLYDESDTAPENDGYEIPRSSMRRKASEHSVVSETVNSNKNSNKSDINSDCCKNGVNDISGIEHLLNEDTFKRNGISITIPDASSGNNTSHGSN